MDRNPKALVLRKSLGKVEYTAEHVSKSPNSALKFLHVSQPLNRPLPAMHYRPWVFTFRPYYVPLPTLLYVHSKMKGAPIG